VNRLPAGFFRALFYAMAWWDAMGFDWHATRQRHRFCRAIADGYAALYLPCGNCWRDDLDGCATAFLHPSYI